MKKIVVILLIISTMLLMVSCTETPTDTSDSTSDNTDSTSQKIVVDISASTTSVKVNEEVTFNIMVSNAKDVSTCGFKIIYDSSIFELTGGEMGLVAEVSDFSDGVGVLAFSDTIDIKDPTTVLTFKLKAKTTISQSSVSCEASFKGSENQILLVDSIQAEVITVTE